ncbi:hypothetical protein ACR2R9_004325 [Cronobacter sakazakii]
MKWLLLICPVAFVTGWLLFPFITLFASGNCITRSVLIYDEPRGVVTSHAEWNTLRGGTQHHYTSHITLRLDNGTEEKFSTERVVTTSARFHWDSVGITTVKSFRIEGPGKNDPRAEKYSDPLSREGFSARIYFFRAGERLFSGFNNRPLVTCEKKKG